ncbi:hypothetical protein [Serratia marcescens]|uniref:hypothetical protein n=1 Tax=Serratia marcescens TaxID=615 RepID=UPI0015738D8F|nr:hypothetical protein [Serratia marcescens]NSM15242.1 hypothetical protein [Serratia marcescens]NSM95658.1 hypothetical protein [Serratia marcescens]
MTEEEWLDGLRHLSHDQIIQVHFGLQEQIKAHYKLRAENKHLKKAIVLCEQQIALAPLAMKALKAKHEANLEEYRSVLGDVDREFYYPTHHGYRQYAVILRRQKDFDKLAKIEAKRKLEGWAG